MHRVIIVISTSAKATRKDISLGFKFNLSPTKIQEKLLFAWYEPKFVLGTIYLNLTIQIKKSGASSSKKPHVFIYCTSLTRDKFLSAHYFPGIRNLSVCKGLIQNAEYQCKRAWIRNISRSCFVIFNTTLYKLKLWFAQVASKIILQEKDFCYTISK